MAKNEKLKNLITRVEKFYCRYQGFGTLRHFRQQYLYEKGFGHVCLSTLQPSAAMVLYKELLTHGSDCVRGVSKEYFDFNVPFSLVELGLPTDAAGMRRFNIDIYDPDNKLILRSGRLATQSVIQKLQTHCILIHEGMFEPLAQEPVSSHPEEKIVVDGEMTTPKELDAKLHMGKDKKPISVPTRMLKDASQECAGNDPVNHPKHYTNHPSGVECIQITEHMRFNLGNAMKYIWRADLKGNTTQDLEKAIWYIQRELQLRKSKPTK